MNNIGLSINAIVQKAHTTAMKKGFWEDPISFPEGIALIHSELSEALEHYREGCEPSHLMHRKGTRESPEGNIINYVKPDGIPAELADAIIRICDLSAYYDIDLEQAILEKMEFNEGRPYMHGKIL